MGYVLILTQNGLGYILGIFFIKTVLVTLIPDKTALTRTLDVFGEDDAAHFFEDGGRKMVARDPGRIFHLIRQKTQLKKIEQFEKGSKTFAGFDPTILQQGCHIFLGTIYQMTTHIQNYQIPIKYTQWS
jgi:hypothetical protein